MIFDFGEEVYSTDIFEIETCPVSTVITLHLEGSRAVVRAEKKDPFDHLMNLLKSGERYADMKGFGFYRY